MWIKSLFSKVICLSVCLSTTLRKKHLFGEEGAKGSWAEPKPSMHMVRRKHCIAELQAQFKKQIYFFFWLLKKFLLDIFLYLHLLLKEVTEFSMLWSLTTWETGKMSYVRNMVIHITVINYSTDTWHCAVSRRLLLESNGLLGHKGLCSRSGCQGIKWVPLEN